LGDARYGKPAVETEMQTVEVRTRLNKVFCDVFDDDSIKISDAMIAKDVEGWDSMMHVDLVVAVEREFGIKFTTKEVNNLANVGDFIHLIDSRIR
jgi:acyl carrier protein